MTNAIVHEEHVVRKPKGFERDFEVAAEIQCTTMLRSLRGDRLANG